MRVYLVGGGRYLRRYRTSPQTCIVAVPGRLFVARRGPRAPPAPALPAADIAVCFCGNDVSCSFLGCPRLSVVIGRLFNICFTQSYNYYYDYIRQLRKYFTVTP